MILIQAYFQFILTVSLIFIRYSEPLKIPPGYYHGADKAFTGVFVKVEDSVTFVDFILWDKYPRELLSDTLNNANLARVSRRFSFIDSGQKL